jgi:predicted RNase H-like nuclease (RuvC/YqgF family)
VEGIGGYTRAEFVVDAPREKVHLNPGYYSDAQYRVDAVERPKLQFTPLVRKRGYIIVGLDPGTTTGIAALNLKGELIDIISSREMSSSDVIVWIAARGNPLIVATDVFPTPGAVEKVKRSFNAVLYSPGADVPAEEKIALAKEYGYKNDHERDALAAASSAFKKYKNKFSQVEKKVPPEVDQEEVKALVVRGRSVENAVAELTPVPEAVAMPEAQHQPEVCASPDAEAVVAHKAQVQQLSEQVRTLRSYIEDLRSDLGERDEALARMRQKLDRVSDKASREIKRCHEIKIRDKEIERLSGLLRSERKYNKKLKKELSFKRKTEKVVERVEEIQGYKRLKPVEVFSKEAVSRATERWEISKGDLILLENPSGGGPNTADLLMERGIEAVILVGEMSPAVMERFEAKGVPVFSSKDLPVRKIDGIAFVNPLEVEAARARLTEKMKARQAEKKNKWLEGIIQEYRTERKKEEKRKLRQ